MMKKTLTALALAGALTAGMTAIGAGPLWAADEINVAPGLSAAGAPVALHGADPVALLDGKRHATGTAEHTAVHGGAAYYFASAANKAAFEKNPARYLVQNGGFCTFGVSVGKKFDGDPRYASVVDGKLYVFLNEEIYQMYLEDKAGTIAKAAENWDRIEHIAATDL